MIHDSLRGFGMALFLPSTFVFLCLQLVSTKAQIGFGLPIFLTSFCCLRTVGLWSRPKSSLARFLNRVFFKFNISQQYFEYGFNFHSIFVQIVLHIFFLTKEYLKIIITHLGAIVVRLRDDNETQSLYILYMSMWPIIPRCSYVTRNGTTLHR